MEATELEYVAFTTFFLPTGVLTEENVRLTEVCNHVQFPILNLLKIPISNIKIRVQRYKYLENFNIQANCSRKI